MCQVLTVALVLGALLLAPSSLSAAPRQGIALRSATIDTQPHPFAVVVIDLNHDEKPDLGLTHAPIDSASVCLGNGDGTFAPCRDLGRIGDNPRGLAAGDFNRDGAIDLAVAATQNDAVLVLNGLGGGRFAPPRRIGVGRNPFLLASADLNRDEIPDVVAALEGSGVLVLLADGRGGFKQTSYPTGKWSSDVAVADFNQDGAVDLAVTNWGSNDVSIIAGKGDGSFHAARNITYEGNPWDHHSLYRVLSADLDRDGRADMVWNDIIKQSLYVLYGNGGGEFPRHVSVPAGRGVRYADAADLNGDGWLDLVSANTADNDVTILLGDQRGGFGAPQRQPVGQHPRMAVTRDLNGDDRPDIVVTNLKKGGVTVLLNDGVSERASPADDAPESLPPATELRQPYAVIRDQSGQLLVSDQGQHRVVRVDPADGSMTAVAGSGHKGYGGDGGPASRAQFLQPAGLALDGAGNLYIADSGNHRVRKVDVHGTVSTVAGTGQAGDGGDGGLAAQAQLRTPVGIAVDRAGTLYIADSGNSRVRKVDAGGVITTATGTGVAGYSGDGGAAPQAQVRNVTALAIAPDGSLLLADPLNFRIRRIGPDGIMSTVAGNGTSGRGGDGAPATRGQLGYPGLISVGGDGSVYIADPSNQLIRAVRPDGTLATVARAPAAASSETPGPADSYWEPIGVAVDEAGNLFLTDRKNRSLWRRDAAGSVTVVTGAAPKQTRLHTVRTVADSLPLLPADRADPAISLTWEYIFRSGSDDNTVYAVLPSANGGVHIAGDIGTGADWRIQHLDAGGKPGWHHDFDGGNVDVPLALSTAHAGEIIAAGFTVSVDESGRDVLVTALGPDGSERWRYRNPAPGDQLARAITADAAGNVYVAGESDGNWELLSLDPAGTLRWRHVGGGRGSANAISRDAAGHIYLAGNESSGWRVLKLNPDRTVAWEHRVHSASADGIAATADGGAVVVGSRTSDRLNLRAERLDARGAVMWEYEASSPIGAVVAKAVALDRAGNALIVGDISSDWLVLCLTPQGKRRWYFTHDGGGTMKNRDQAFSVALQGPDSFVVGGRVHPLPPEPPSLGPVEWRVAAYRLPVGEPRAQARRSGTSP